MPNVNTTYKDRLFRKLFGFEERKNDLLSLYNALNGTSFDNPDALEINTIDDVIFMKMKNDVSCLVDGNMALFEHQSSWNPNMPLRGFLYFGKLYSKYLDSLTQSVHSHRLIKIPTPQFFVLYNGDVGRMGPNREKAILKLSDAFDHPPKEGEFEWTATVVNINYGYNSGILNACQTLKEYSLLVDRVNCKRNAGLSIKEAVVTAVDECIEEKILFPYLRDHKAEVIDVCLTEYDEKKHLASERMDAFNEGKIRTIISLRLDGDISVEKAASKLDMNVEDYLKLEAAR